MVRFLDEYFSEFGRDSLEFESSCNSATFFSWFRHEGTWSKCKHCKDALFDKLVEGEENKSNSNQENAEVKLHAFAKFCGENLLLSIRDLITSAHPWNSSRYQLINPDCKNSVSSLSFYPRFSSYDGFFSRSAFGPRKHVCQ